MPRYNSIDRRAKFLPVVLTEPIQPATFEFALDHLVDNDLDLSGLDARFRHDKTGAMAFDPRVLPKILQLAYGRGLIILTRVLGCAGVAMRAASTDAAAVRRLR